MILSFTHCSSSGGGGGGGGGSDPVYTCTNGTPSEGRPDGDSDVESCASCNAEYNLVDRVCKGIFSLHSNSVTVLCPNNEIGDVGMVGGVEYTKRTAADIRADNSLAATSCTSGITDISSLFVNAASFNQDIGHWDVSSVTNMSGLFVNAASFNQDIGSWDVSSVTNMSGMFASALSFNQDLSGWCVSGISSDPGFAYSTPAGFTADRQPQWGDPCP